MKSLNQYSIPYKGLGEGVHNLRFIVDEMLFKYYDNEVIKDGYFEVDVTFDKLPGISTLEFDIKGKYNTLCDRCTAEIYLPVSGLYKLLLKPGNEEDSTDEVLFIHPDTSTLSLAKIIYEYILLSVPMIKVYECENESERPCNFPVLDKLSDNESKQLGSSIWDQLNELDLNNN